MFPRWHVLYGAIFAAVIFWLAPGVGISNVILIFLSSFLIDFDHYVNAVVKTRQFSLKSAFDYHDEEGRRQHKEKKRGIRRRGDFHLFHTLEFHALIGVLGIFWSPFFFIFIGMVFHSLLDIVSLVRDDYMYRREYFLTKWISNKVGELE